MIIKEIQGRLDRTNPYYDYQVRDTVPAIAVTLRQHRKVATAEVATERGKRCYNATRKMKPL